MIFLIWLVLCLVAVSLILLFPALWVRDYYRRYSGWRRVTCPENQQPEAVSMDAHHAASTGIHGLPDVRLCDCTRWPGRSGCARACLSQAVQARPYRPGEVTIRSKRIYHLPILLAAFAAWCLGAIWHSQYLFRPSLTNALGLPHAQVKQMVWWNSPHLLTLAASLLFAYGVGWLLAVCHRKGILNGILMSALLGGALLLTSWYSIAGLPHELLVIEAAYAILATLTVGAIVGGLYNKLVLPLQ